jgi:hypothetical protein
MAYHDNIHQEPSTNNKPSLLGCCSRERLWRHHLTLELPSLIWLLRLPLLSVSAAVAAPIPWTEGRKDAPRQCLMGSGGAMAMGSGQRGRHGRGLMHSGGMVCVLAAGVLPAAGCDLIYPEGQSRSPG